MDIEDIEDLDDIAFSENLHVQRLGGVRQDSTEWEDLQVAEVDGFLLVIRGGGGFRLTACP